MPLWSITEDRGVLVASYHNPPMNYFIAEGAVELGSLIDRCGSPDVRVLILTGGEKGRFITHYSVEELVDLAADREALAKLGTGLNTGYYALLQRLRDLPKPVIVAMNGDTMGGGFELSLACDIRIFARGDHRVGLPETRLGIIPGGSGTQALSRLIGAGRAVEFILRGRVVGPEEALTLNLVHELADDALERALQIAHDLASQAPAALAMAKKAVYQGSDMPLAQGLLVEAEASISVIGSDDGFAKMKEYLSQPLSKRRDWLDRAR